MIFRHFNLKEKYKTHCVKTTKRLVKVASQAIFVKNGGNMKRLKP